MIKAFPKIFHIGTSFISDIFVGPVEITEKIDGSQFVFGKDLSGHLFMRSKGAQLFAENPEKMFEPAINYVLSIQQYISRNTAFYCEYLRSPKHNTLTYSRIPRNHLMLWGVSNFIGDRFTSQHTVIEEWADDLDIEPVPLLYYGEIQHPDDILKFMHKESGLGGAEAEGVVVKNYAQQFLLGGQPIPVMAGKYVSEAFKEVHRTGWAKENTAVGKWQAFKDGYATEARWAKAVQHLRDAGKLTDSPRDIGPLLKEIKDDIVAEEKEIIMEFLWKEFGPDVLRRAVAGFPDWYKQQLLMNAFACEVTK